MRFILVCAVGVFARTAFENARAVFERGNSADSSSYLSKSRSDDFDESNPRKSRPEDDIPTGIVSRRRNYFLNPSKEAFERQETPKDVKSGLVTSMRARFSDPMDKFVSVSKNSPEEIPSGMVGRVRSKFQELPLKYHQRVPEQFALMDDDEDEPSFVSYAQWPRGSEAEIGKSED